MASFIATYAALYGMKAGMIVGVPLGLYCRTTMHNATRAMGGTLLVAGTATACLALFPMLRADSERPTSCLPSPWAAEAFSSDSPLDSRSVMEAPRQHGLPSGTFPHDLDAVHQYTVTHQKKLDVCLKSWTVEKHHVDKAACAWRVLFSWLEL